ncbi:pantetheine-phosphate adenylyltransferase [Thermincola ferriacetica]|uniref:Phosphopantetheine adenylyltransferase n=2 Tax=Thermincola TaxID=278993 RepID=D5X8Q5_THEPJ|nr:MULTISPECIES: pantetheine-phosphate adenylyltransferase [Thermincola]ADG82931.1 pantetheine-phosphate adenylyltransferase [Thermincola potens JR]KNZ68543.1 pantetheine-phosphate adenylyltransferase [Thermincola ferriacetica]
MKIGIYPGSFDPITYGHMDIIERASRFFDKVIVAVSKNSRKQPLFTIEERVDMLNTVLHGYANVEVDSFYGLTVDYAERKGAHAIIRGLRAISDFENEFQMALTNKKLKPGIETVFLMTQPNFSFLSSSVVRELAAYGGCVRDFVPPFVEKRLREKFTR